MSKHKKDAQGTRLTKQQAEEWLRDRDGCDLQVEGAIDERVINISHGQLWVDLGAKNGRPRILAAARPFEPKPQPLLEFAFSLTLTDKTKLFVQEFPDEGKTLLGMIEDDATVELFFDKPRT